MTPSTSRIDVGGLAIEDPLIATASLEVANSTRTDSDGDLWPSTWADDGALYAANGDGAGFSNAAFADIVVNRIEGESPSALTGTRLASGDDICPLWGDPGRFNRKPTGMVAVDGNGDSYDELYLAVQEMPFSGDEVFNQAPLATIVRSDDGGHTWTNPGAPMFTDHVFTTVMFLDYGQSQQHAAVLGPEDATYVYAYGLDGNWRSSYSRTVPNPDRLFLARVPRNGILHRDQWQFYAGTNAGRPTWSGSVADRIPVLVDEREVPAPVEPMGSTSHSVISQGGVVYNAPLRRYLYTSWTEYTFQIYSSPQPWGPWTLLGAMDFGPYPWNGPNTPLPQFGGYGTTIPSKFISDDGCQMWLQSNWFWRASTFGGTSYAFSMRRLALGLRQETPAPPAPGVNLAAPERGGVPIATTCRSGQYSVFSDPNDPAAVDSWNGETGREVFWGHTWEQPQTFNEVRLLTGPRDYVSGWFTQCPRIEIRTEGRWQPVTSAVTPNYPGDATATGHREFVFTFDPVVSDGVRLIGVPHGDPAYSALSALSVIGCDADGPGTKDTTRRREPDDHLRS